MKKEQRGHDTIMIHKERQWNIKLNENLRKIEEQTKQSKEMKKLKRKADKAENLLNQDRAKNEDR